MEIPVLQVDMAKHRNTCTRFIIAGLIVICVTFYVMVIHLPSDSCNCDHIFAEKRALLLAEESRRKNEELEEIYLMKGDNPSWGIHKLCLVVPFRDRFEELIEFGPHMHKFLNYQKIRHKILIIDQVDNLRFNRASLINIGFLQAESHGCDYIAMHDVDLMPLNPALNYSYPAEGPFHVSAPYLHPKYHYRTFVGGILLITMKHFRMVNGLSNRYWGWGREDDEFYVRMVEAEFTIRRPKNITTGYETFKHFHEKIKRPRDYKRYGNQKKMDRKRDRVTGLDTVQYDIVATEELKIDNAPALIIRVELFCDLEQTPWCVNPEQLNQMLSESKKAQEKAEAEVKAAQNQMEVAQNQMKIAQKQMQESSLKIKPLGKNDNKDVDYAEEMNKEKIEGDSLKQNVHNHRNRKQQGNMK